MRLKKITLTNFQGIENMTIDFNKDLVKIYGDNATGKTTIANAFSWLLFDKSSAGEKGFSPKTIGKDGELHFLEHSVVAVFSDGNSELELKKTFYEKYKKIRGRDSQEFTGHTTDYEINGVPSKKKEFDSFIEEKFGSVEQVQVLTNPFFFSETLDWQKRRNILLDICGNITDADVFKSMGEDGDRLEKALSLQADGITVDDFITTIKAKKSKVNKKIDELPSRIDEAKKAVPDMDINSDFSKDIEDIKHQIIVLETEINNDEKNAVNVVEDELMRIKRDIQKIEIEHQEEQNKKTKLFMETLNKKQLELLAKKSRIRELEQEHSKLKDDINTANEKRTELIEEFKTIKKKVFDENDLVCPTCQQELPEEKKAELIASFNENKSSQLENINKKGKLYDKSKIEKMLLQCDSLVKDIDNLKLEEQSINSNIEEIKKSQMIDDAENNNKHLSFKADYETKYNELLENKNKRLELVGKKTEEKKKSIEKLEIKLRDYMEKNAVISFSKVQLQRVSDLIEEQKELSVAYEKLEELVFLSEMFIRKKAEMLDDLINTKFNSVKFKLTEEQINGGVKDICEVLVPAVDGVTLIGFASANNASRINAGLEIIEKLSAYWGKDVTVFVDNAESVTKLKDINVQVVGLYVSENDKKLRVV